MKTLKLIAAALAVPACFSSALAADVYYRGSIKETPVTAAPAIWTGVFIGVGGGGAVFDYDAEMAGVLDQTDLGFTSESNLDRASAFGTIQIGYDRQVRERVVVGLFADYDWHGDTDQDFGVSFVSDATNFLNVSATAEIENVWTIGGRVGFLATPATMIYALAAWTHADFNVQSVFTGQDTDNLVGFAASGDDSVDGITLGAGVETMLRHGLTLKVEYRYTDFGDLSLSGSQEGDAVGSVDVEAELHSARAVLSWRPGGL
jgi:outer membrane immunogenic protein